MKALLVTLSLALASCGAAPPDMDAVRDAALKCIKAAHTQAQQEACMRAAEST
jgi:starvation-inducible outer membrane lipoprotein